MASENKTTNYSELTEDELVSGIHAELDKQRVRTAILSRRARAGEDVAYRAEAFLDALERKYPGSRREIHDERDALLAAISELRRL